MFGFQRRGVRRCENDTLLPKPGRLPQTSQTEATGSLHWVIASWVTVRSGPERLVKDIRPPGLDANRMRTPRSSVSRSSLRGMAAEVLDEETVRRWCRLSVDALAQTRAAIDALNVFPVPDADTGTNLHLTLVSAAEAVESVPPGAGPAEIWPAVARGALLGACGNSGIIVSQLLRGLADVCAAEPRCDGPVVARALTHAAASARAAVSRPAEGTVLTVADAAARAPAEAAGSRGLAAVVTAAAAAARQALAGTREQLDVLAARGVVDAGAAGLCVLLDALVAAVTGARPEAFEVPAPAPRPAAAGAAGAAGAAASQQTASPGYEVTYLLEAPAEPVRQLRERLDSLGDSLVIVGSEDLWKDRKSTR